MNKIFNSLARTPYQTISTFLILTLSLFLILMAVASTMFSYSFLNYLDGRPNVRVYFELKTTESDIMSVRKMLLGTGLTSSVRYVSSNEALALYKKFNTAEPELFDLITADNLPASLEIKANKPTDLTQIANIARNQPFVNDVQFQKNTLARLLTFTSGLRALTTTLVVALLSITLIILMTLTAFKIALKKDEIYLLQLLGASRTYIISPYLKESVFMGLLSSFIAWGVFFLIIILLESNLANFFLGITNLTSPLLKQIGVITYPPNAGFFLLTFSLASILGVLTSLLGTYLASTRYIKVK